MPRWIVMGLLLLGLALAEGSEASAQGASSFDDPPKLYPSQPLTRKEWARRESLKQYVLGLLCEREDRLLEALKAYEEAARLDPEAPAVFKAQIPLFIASNRRLDALAAAEKALALDPHDHHTWFVAARLYKVGGQFAEAKKCLQGGLAAPRLKDHPDIAQEMYIDLATLQENVNELAPAIVSLTEAAKILDHPDVLLEHGPFNRDKIVLRAAETYERIGNLHRKLKQYDEAIAAYQKAQDRAPERAGRLNFNLAQISREQNNHAQALAYLDLYLRLQPSGLEAYEMKIDLLRKLDKTAAIVPWLDKAILGDPNHGGLKVLLAKEHAAAKDFGAAEKLYKWLVADSPSPDAYRGLFHLHKDNPAAGMKQSLALLNQTFDAAKKAQGPPGLAAQQAKAMLHALREDGDLARELVRAGFQQADLDDDLKFETLHLLAVLADKHRQSAEAEKFYRAALLKATPATEALVYGGLLRALWKSHKYQEILAVCEAGVNKAQATNRILFLNDKAKALAQLGRHDEAIKAAGDAVNFAGDNDRLAVRSTRVRVYVIAEKYALAEAECQAMLKEYLQQGEILEVRYLLSTVYSQQKKLQQAEEQLELILQADPNNVTVNNDLGYIWADQNKNLERADAMIRKAIELDRLQRKLSRNPGADDDRDNAAYVDSLGWVLFRLGKLDEAREQLELAVTLPGGDDPVLWDHLGDVYHRQGRLEQARNAWQRSIHLYEQEKRRKMDERYREVQNKLKLIESVKK